MPEPGAGKNELNRFKAALLPGDCVKVSALDRLGRSLTEVLELLGWLRESGVGRASAVSGLRRYRTCASVTASHVGGSPR